MPLPLAGAQWPPAHLDPITAKLGEWDAWYVGDVDGLYRTYSTQQGLAQRIDRPGQYRGGVVGAISRFWWGRPVGDLSRQVDSDKVHVPIAADLCQASADLLFAEPPSLTTDDTTAQAELDAAIEGGLFTQLSEGAEVAAALGDVYLRTTWDTQLADRSFITPVHADAAIPEFRWGRLVAVTFWWAVHHDGQRVLRHLERHELDQDGNGVIFHGLYEGTPTALGRQVPLTEHPSTAGIQVNDQAMIQTGPGLAVVHVPNQTPQRRWRKHPLGRNLGRSDLDGIEGLMDKLDMVYSSWMRDVRLAKSRIIVPSFMLDNLGPGQGAMFDSDQDVFTPLAAPPSEDSASQITPQQFAIRFAEHQATCQQLLDDILRTAGYSRQTFGEGEDVAVTATEVTSKDRRSALTRDRKIRNFTPPLQAILAKKLQVDADLFGTRVPAGTSVDVQFVDVTQADPLQLAQTTQTLFQAQSASTETRVRLMHPDWDETAVAAEVGRILSEFGSPVPDPAEFRPGVDEGSPTVTPTA